MITFEEMRLFENKKIRVQLTTGRVLTGFCPYVLPKEPGEEEENAIFFDQGENKYYIEQSEISRIEVIA